MYLGIDIGTSGVKAVIIDEAGSILSHATTPLTVSRPEPLWSEQAPDDWWRAADAAVKQLPADQRLKVQAVGLSGQMHGATVLGDDDQPLRPAILWNDGRSHEECVELAALEPRFLRIGGNLVMPGFTAPKLAWLKRHESHIFHKIKSVLLPKDYVRLVMTGNRASDMSDSAGTLWLNVANRSWSEPLLAACGLSVEQMPTLYEGPEATGFLRAEIAADWGCDRVPVVAGGSDNAAGALGGGVVGEGEILLSLGTSGVIFAATQEFRPFTNQAVHAFCHALPDRWHQMSVMLSAASCLDWACQITELESPGALVALAEENARLGVDEHFLPYLSGERTPHNNPYACGVLSGLTFETGKAAIAQAVLEGVAFGMADGLSAILASGTEVDAISVIGGGSRSLHWGRILAAVLCKPMVYRDGAATGPAYGAARLARHHIMDGNLSEMFAPPAIVSHVEPTADDINILAPKYERFKRLYRALEPEFSA